MSWWVPAVVICVTACTAPPPLKVTACPEDAGITLEWSSPDADAVLLIDGDGATAEAKEGRKWIAADRTKLVRVAAVRNSATTWSVTPVEACPVLRDGGVGTVLLGDGAAAADMPITVDGVEALTSGTGGFAVPDGEAPYSLFYRSAFGPAGDLHTNVLIHQITAASPIVRSTIGHWGREAELRVQVTSAVTQSGPGYVTIVVARVGSESSGDQLNSPEGSVSFPLYSWQGSPSAIATVTAVRMYMRSFSTNDNRDLPEILGASRPVQVEVRDGQLTQVALHIEPVAADVRDLYLPTELGNVENYIGYGSPGSGGFIYSGRANSKAKLPTVSGEGYWQEWVVSEPAPRDGTYENGARGSGQYVVPRDGPVIAPLYRAARLTTRELASRGPHILDWELSNRCLCRARISQRSGFQNWVVYSRGPVDLRDVGIINPGDYKLELDCFPEIATVDDVLRGERGLQFFTRSGRLARVQTLDSFTIR